MPRTDVAITVTDDAGADVVALAGDLDILGAGRVGVALNGAVRRGRQPVVIDLAALRFIDSSGLALLMNAARRLQRSERGFAVVAPPGRAPRRVIEVARLADALHVADDRPAALSAAGAIAATPR